MCSLFSRLGRLVFDELWHIKPDDDSVVENRPTPTVYPAGGIVRCVFKPNARVSERRVSRLWSDLCAASACGVATGRTLLILKCLKVVSTWQAG